MIVVQFAGRELTVPKEYFPIWAVPRRRDEPDTLILQAYLPNYTAIRTQKPSDGGYAERVQIILRHKILSLNTIYTIAAPNRIFTEPIRDVYGLRMFRTAMDSGDPTGRIYEVYFAAKNDIALLRRVPALRRSPQCHDKLAADGIWFEIVYHRQYLSEWRDIEERSIDLVRSFMRAGQ